MNVSSGLRAGRWRGKCLVCASLFSCADFADSHYVNAMHDLDVLVKITQVIGAALFVTPEPNSAEALRNTAPDFSDPVEGRSTRTFCGNGQ